MERECPRYLSQIRSAAVRVPVSPRMTKALLEKDGVHWRQKLPPIPTVPVAAQTRWSGPSAGGSGANTSVTAWRGEPGESMPLG